MPKNIQTNQTICVSCGKTFPRSKAFTGWGRTYCSPACFNKSVGKRQVSQTNVVGYTGPHNIVNNNKTQTTITSKPGGCGACGKAR